MAIKNCHKCGRNFARVYNEIICDGCRLPKRGSRSINPELTNREKQTIQLIAQGKSNRQVAEELLLTVGGIKEKLNWIFKKTGVKRREELIVWAFNNRLAFPDYQQPKIVTITPEGVAKVG